MQAMKDMAGQRFGRLMDIERDGVDGSGNVMWRCLCDCGKTTVVRGGHLRSGQVKLWGAWTRVPSFSQGRYDWQSVRKAHRSQKKRIYRF